MRSVSDEVEIGKSRTTAKQENIKSGDSETSKPEKSENKDIRTSGHQDLTISRNQGIGIQVMKHEEKT